MFLASCGDLSAGDREAFSNAEGYPSQPFTVEEKGTFEHAWAADFEPGAGNLFITEAKGAIKFVQTATGRLGTVSGVPEVDFGGQGGLGDIAFAPDFETSRAIYLSWIEAGEGKTRGAVVGRGTLVCEDHDSCDIRDLDVIWRQSPKTDGRSHYSHRIAFSPDGQYMFVSSGERGQRPLIQDTTNNISAIVRLNLDGSPAAGNPYASDGGTSAEVWTYGHRNILGMDFDLEGQLWAIEHGPAGGDELNLIKPGRNFGWPVRSNGDEYSGKDIPDHTADDGFTKPVISWTPVIAPGDMTLVTSKLFPSWQGNMLIAGLKSKSLIHIVIEGQSAKEVARYQFGNNIRAVVEGPEGAFWLLETGRGGRLLKLTPAG